MELSSTIPGSDSDIVAEDFQPFDSIAHASGVVMSSPNQAMTDIIPLAVSPRIQSIVRKPGSEWLKYVDCVYLPMIWGNRHWVVLVVNLRTTTIQVLDLNVDLTHERDVKKHISLLASVIPFIMGRCCSSSDAIAYDQRRFNIVRVGGLYQNRRGEDCGHVSVKFLEMHAHGDVVVSGSSMTDETVDELRKQYVVDIYHHYIVPIHIGRLSAME